MPDLPLLLFPTPATASRSSLSRGSSGSISKPSPQRQWDRLSPKFEELQRTLEAKRIEIAETAAGVMPEQLLVITTIGSVKDFANAVRHIEGLEWMGEFETEKMEPDDDFYDETRRDKGLTGRLYLVMTNQQAQDHILSLWKSYNDNQDFQFSHGLTRFRDVFLQLKDIRRWDVRDRLLETGVIDIWQEELEYDGERVIPFEAELWFRGSHELRTQSKRHVENLVAQAGGRILSESVIKEIAYHGLLAELPAQAIRGIVDNPETQLVRCENIMFFRPVGQIVVGEEPPKGEIEVSEIEPAPLPTGDPVIALFDGVPIANHELLANRLIVDDPDNMDAEYEALDRVHGTTMASLILHGDLNQPQPPLSRPVYLRPILKPRESLHKPWPEEVPETCLVVDLIHIAVKRLFDGVEGEEPAAPNVKIINLSIGDKSRQFVQFTSPFARLLDWLSVKYGILFVVSAGNHNGGIQLQLSRDELDTLQDNELEIHIIDAIYRDARNRRILTPSETINGITVGAAHLDGAQIINQGNRINTFTCELPSPVSAFGYGYRRSIKPDLVFYGGRQLYRSVVQPTNPVTIEPAIFRSAPGNKAASPGNSPGELDATAYSCGTSNATALISRSAGICYDSLLEIFNEQAQGIDSSTYIAPLLKAMVVHGCSWGQIGQNLIDRIKESSLGSNIVERANRLYEDRSAITNSIRGQYKKHITDWLGYGFPEINRVLDCTEQRATLLGYGELHDGEAYIYSLPLPPSLSSRHERRRLTVTLAWLSPISVSTQRYRTASLWFEMLNNDLTQKQDLAPKRIDADHHAVKRGTVQHEIFEGRRAIPFADDDKIKIKVNCRNDAGKIVSPVAYGLAVSLEVAEELDIDVYNEIRTRIVEPVQIQPHAEAE